MAQITWRNQWPTGRWGSQLRALRESAYIDSELPTEIHKKVLAHAISAVWPVSGNAIGELERRKDEPQPRGQAMTQRRVAYLWAIVCGYDPTELLGIGDDDPTVLPAWRDAGREALRQQMLAHLHKQPFKCLDIFPALGAGVLAGAA